MRLTVMHVVLSLSPGGTERLVIEIVRRLIPRSIGSLVCCLDDAGEWATELYQVGVPVVALNRAPGFRPGVARSIAKLARVHQVDVLHCHHYSPFVYGQMATLLQPRLRVVFTEHGRLSDAPPSRKRQIVNPILGRLPHAIYAVSADLRQHMIAEGFPADRVKVNHNGIDPGQPSTGAHRARARAWLGLPEDAFVLGSVARLDPVKDMSTLIHGLRVVRSLTKRCRLVIIGDGPERPALESLTNHLGLKDGVIFTGHRNDARALLPGLDVYVNSSIHEGVSLTILEAMAASLPVVATWVGGNPEVVKNGETGQLVQPRSPEAIASAVLPFAHDPVQRFTMGEASRRHVLSDFTIDRMIGQYERSYWRDPPHVTTAHESRPIGRMTGLRVQSGETESGHLRESVPEPAACSDRE